MPQKRVLILGGGVAGLSAAQELAERDFPVTIWEKEGTDVGGRARSAVRDGLPTEHGFHFFPAFYNHLHDTLKRIPDAYLTGNGATLASSGGGSDLSPHSVDDALVPSSRIVLAREGRVELPFDFDLHSPTDIFTTLKSFVRLGLSPAEVSLATAKLARVAMDMRTGTDDALDQQTWWDYIEADSQSKAYQQYFGDVAVRWTVAMDPRKASARTIGRTAIRFWTALATANLRPAGGGDEAQMLLPFAQVLDGPTSAQWLTPWRNYLVTRLRVTIEKVEVKDIVSDRRVVTAVQGLNAESEVRFTDFAHCICALPITPFADIIDRNGILRDSDPGFRKIPDLKRALNWMVGLQFFLDKDVPIARGGLMLRDSPWALTAISQSQFWKQKEWSFQDRNQGTKNPPFRTIPIRDGAKVKGVLSVIVSDWEKRGHFQDKTAKSCNEEELFWEVWLELKAHLNAGRQRGPEAEDVLKDDNLLRYYCSIRYDAATAKWENPDPLFINTRDAVSKRPAASTQLRNFFIAGDYVKTYTDLATMEAANESARRAVNGLLKEAKSPAARCQLFPVETPFLKIAASGARRGAQLAGGLGTRLLRASSGLVQAFASGLKGEGDE